MACAALTQGVSLLRPITISRDGGGGRLGRPDANASRLRAAAIYARRLCDLEQLREMQDSGLVEVASHTYDLHRGILANPQGNQIPAVIIPGYDAQHYETTDEYTARIRADLAHSAAEIRAKLGRAPRAIMWPYGGYNEVSNAIAASLGMSVSFTLGLPSPFPIDLLATWVCGHPRLVLMSNPTAENLHGPCNICFKSDIRRPGRPYYIYDSDPVQQERNLSVLLERIKTLESPRYGYRRLPIPAEATLPPRYISPIVIYRCARTCFRALPGSCGRVAA